ncbi:MAG: ribosomal-protein-alanine N-acetyltransferase [Bacilli bacterium]|nr:ribosomal-protein-alanine N-acetyltransferase [Bacilli bacterium]
MNKQLDPYFRKMQASDIDRILDIEHLSFTAPWSRNAFEGELHNHFAKYLVIVVGEEVAGYGGMWIILDEAHVTNIALHPDYRGRGLGGKLMERLMAEAIAHGAMHMTLEVRVSNLVAQSLYLRMGFVKNGMRKGYYTDNQEDAIIMWARLSHLRDWRA